MLGPVVAWYLVMLGLGMGLTVLLLTAYLYISPRWLKWVLLVIGLFVISRYVTMALFATSANPNTWWGLRRCWFATSVGLTFPGVVALDQLVRHPAMTPKKLMQWFSPFLGAYAVVLLLGQFELVPDPVVGMSPRLVGWAVGVLAFVQAVFVTGFLGVSLLLIKKLPSPRIQMALAGLMVAYASLGLDGLLVALHRWYVRPFLFSEIAALVALWFAFDTARHHSL